MRLTFPAFVSLVALLCQVAAAEKSGHVYKWVDEDGVTHYGDSIPAEYAEQPKQILNDQGIQVDELEGKKSEAQLEAERLAREREMEQEKQRRIDQTLLATYGNVDEILMHRDRRVELFQAQARVTELYLRNTQRRLSALERDARRFRPYSEDPDAPMIDEGLLSDIRETRQAIERQRENLQNYKDSQEQVIARFEGDISRFKTLKGIDD